jgi:hypothetical protein
MAVDMATAHATNHPVARFGRWRIVDSWVSIVRPLVSVRSNVPSRSRLVASKRHAAPFAAKRIQSRPR